MSLIGTLREMQIADVLRLFAEGQKTGLMTVSRPGREALLRFQKGALIFASAGRLQGDDVVLDLFGWSEGQLTFVPDDKQGAVPNVEQDVRALVMEGLRVGDTFHKMNELMPTDRVVFCLGVGPADDATYPVGATEWRVIRLLDGVRDLKDVAEASGLAPADVRRILYELSARAFVQRVETQKVLRAHGQGLFGKETAEVDERLREDWSRTSRFENGILRIQVRAMNGRNRSLPVSFRAGLVRDIHLPRAAMAELGLRDGEDVHVRPIG